MDIFANPIVVFVLGALALPGVTSLATKFLRGLGDEFGINPRVVVYLASVVLTGAALWASGDALPGGGGDPVALVSAWLAWTTVNAEIARRLYESLAKQVLA